MVFNNQYTTVNTQYRIRESYHVNGDLMTHRLEPCRRRMGTYSTLALKLITAGDLFIIIINFAFVSRMAMRASLITIHPLIFVARPTHRKPTCVACNKNYSRLLQYPNLIPADPTLLDIPLLFCEGRQHGGDGGDGGAEMRVSRFIKLAVWLEVPIVLHPTVG